MTVEQASGPGVAHRRAGGPAARAPRRLRRARRLPRRCIGLLAALEHRRATGEGLLVEAPLVEAALNIAAEQTIEWTANGVLLEREGNRCRRRRAAGRLPLRRRRPLRHRLGRDRRAVGGAGRPCSGATRASCRPSTDRRAAHDELDERHHRLAARPPDAGGGGGPGRRRRPRRAQPRLPPAEPPPAAVRPRLVRGDGAPGGRHRALRVAADDVLGPPPARSTAGRRRRSASTTPRSSAPSASPPRRSPPSRRRRSSARGRPGSDRQTMTERMASPPPMAANASSSRSSGSRCDTIEPRSSRPRLDERDEAREVAQRLRRAVVAALDRPVGEDERQDADGHGDVVPGHADEHRSRRPGGSWPAPARSATGRPRPRRRSRRRARR